MPDDVKETTVTEQTTEAKDDSTLASEGLQDAKEAFDEESDETPVKEKADEKPEEDKLQKADEKVTEEEDGDEDLQRAKDLIADEEKREKEQKEAEEAELKKAEQEKVPEEVKVTPLTPDDIRIYNNVIPMEQFPEAIDIDGTSIDLKGFLDVNPEVRTVSAIVAKGIVDTLVSNKYLISAEVHEKAIEDIRTEFRNQRFIDRVDASLGADSVKIYNSPEFAKWFGEHEGMKPLLRSGDETDHVRLFKRFLNDSGMKQAKEKVTAIDKRRQERKEKAEAIYGSTARSKVKTSQATKGLSPRDEAMDAFNSED